MAAKQGLTAQLSQASEDAKRAVLSRTGVSSSTWFSNLNTVCTIKSAPPKTPEVLEMLSTKSGWLFKRNEQHVWQARWCCVVPHMFLYYFDASSSTSGAIVNGASPFAPPPQPSQQQQDEWNAAIQKEGFKQHEKRGFTYLFNKSENNIPDSSSGESGNDGFSESSAREQMSPPLPPPGTPTTTTTGLSTAALQPAGIIDLECYSAVHRSSSRKSSNGAHVLELAGDDTVNPDLRAFYFCARTAEEGDDWTDALLNQRHAALLDEVDAYKQVCDGFAHQLQTLHSQVDGLTASNESLQKEIYHIRSANEDVRRKCWKRVEEGFDRHPSAAAISGDASVASTHSSASTTAPVNLAQLRQVHIGNLEQHQRQQDNAAAAVNLMCDYAATLEDSYAALRAENEMLRKKLEATDSSDQQRVQELQDELTALQAEYNTSKSDLTDRLESMTENYKRSCKELQDAQKQFSSAKMEMTMNASQQKNKVQLLQEHKRILKQEVIGLRNKLQLSEKQLAALKAERESSKISVEQERCKAQLLERYVSKIESQVKVQQNMMEMMSIQSGAGGSVYGSIPGGIALRNGNGMSSPGPKDEDEMDDVLRPMNQGGRPLLSSSDQLLAEYNQHNQRQSLADDIDNKSHLSELTEDRTQRHFEAWQHDIMSSPRMMSQQRMSSSPRYPPQSSHQQNNNHNMFPPSSGPPSYIMGGESPSSGQYQHQSSSSSVQGEMYQSSNGDGRMLDTIHSSAASLPPSMNSPSPQQSRSRNMNPYGPIRPKNQGQLSVAQRARRDADHQTTPVRVRLTEDTLSSTSSQRSNQGSLWRRMEEAVLGPRPEDEDLSDNDSMNSTRISDYSDANEEEMGRSERRRRPSTSSLQEEKKTSEIASTSLSLQERSKLQREKQLQFLKEQGLIKDGQDVRGGAGASPARSSAGKSRRQNDTSSVTSSSASFPHSSVSFPGAKTSGPPRHR